MSAIKTLDFRGGKLLRKKFPHTLELAGELTLKFKIETSISHCRFGFRDILMYQGKKQTLCIVFLSTVN